MLFEQDDDVEIRDYAAKFLTSVVARASSSGRQVDEVLTLEGEQQGSMSLPLRGLFGEVAAYV